MPFACWCFLKKPCVVNTSLFVLSSGSKMKHKNFFIVPNQIFELGLKPKALAVYCCLLRHSDKNTDNSFQSRRLIADECSMDKKTVRGQAICITSFLFWNSVGFPYGWIQIFVAILSMVLFRRRIYVGHLETICRLRVKESFE